MKIAYLPRAVAAIDDAPVAVQRAILKQVSFLAENLRHPSLRVKKYDESNGLWQARVNRDWRLYFQIEGDTCTIIDVIPHPK
jgi:mRNA-degrading endonuclease RelE of RelBE toxin-antitoxin system